MAALYSLYIQNRSRQVHDFQYRLPSPPGAETRLEARILSETIEPGKERRIYQEAPLDVLRAIVGQHRLVGLVAIEEAVSSTRLCYRFDPPVDLAEEDRRLAAQAAEEAARRRAFSDAIEAEMGAGDAIDAAAPPEPTAPGPKSRRGFAKEDQPLIEEMHRLILAGKARNPWDATNAVVDRAAGTGTLHSKRQRLLDRYRSVFQNCSD